MPLYSSTKSIVWNQFCHLITIERGYTYQSNGLEQQT